MCVHRLLIADSDDAILLAAKQAFDAEFEVLTCQDGETALELLATFQPQVLVINLLLPFKDGVTVLQEAAILPPVIIATTSIILPHIEQACQSLPIGYLMISPCLNALRVQVITMVNYWENDPSSPDLHGQITLHLHTLNFPKQRTGYSQLCEAIRLYFLDPEQCLDTVLYATIAENAGKTGSAVERAIRTTITRAWEQRDPIVWSKYFPNQKTCPSNKVFFAAIANFLHN